MYFLFFILHGWGKRSAFQPQTIYSEFPLIYTAKKLFTVVMVPCSTAASMRNSPDWL